MGDLGASVGRALGDALNAAVRAVEAAIGAALDAAAGAFHSAGPIVVAAVALAVIGIWLILRR